MHFVFQVNQGGDVPQKYYMENDELLAHMTKATIPRGDKLLVKFDVRNSGCILRYVIYMHSSEENEFGF